MEIVNEFLYSAQFDWGGQLNKTPFTTDQNFRRIIMPTIALYQHWDDFLISDELHKVGAVNIN